MTARFFATLPRTTGRHLGRLFIQLAAFLLRAPSLSQRRDRNGRSIGIVVWSTISRCDRASCRDDCFGSDRPDDLPYTLVPRDE